MKAANIKAQLDIVRKNKLQQNPEPNQDFQILAQQAQVFRARMFEMRAAMRLAPAEDKRSLGPK